MWRSLVYNIESPIHLLKQKSISHKGVPRISMATPPIYYKKFMSKNCFTSSMNAVWNWYVSFSAYYRYYDEIFVMNDSNRSRGTSTEFSTRIVSLPYSIIESLRKLLKKPPSSLLYQFHFNFFLHFGKLSFGTISYTLSLWFCCYYDVTICVYEYIYDW